MEFIIKTKIICGDNGVKIINDLNPKKIFFVTDPYMVKSGMLQKILDYFSKEIEYKVFTDVKPDPSQELVDKAILEYRDFKAEVVVALGGGSAIDLAKAMIYGLLKEVKPLFVAIPTTAGTGSEVTNFAVITRGLDKVVLIDDALFPDYALLIAELTKTVPNFITADTGMDVLTHAIEAYVSKNASDFSDVFAIEAMKLVFKHLKTVYDDGLRMKSREAMLKASCMAGIAFTNAGLGINHSLAHTIGGRFHVAHGRLNAILLPHVIRYNIKKSDLTFKKLTLLVHELGLNSIDEFIELIEKLCYGLDIPSKLSQLNKIDSNEYYAQIDDMAMIALNDRCTPSNPAVVVKFDLANILRDIF